TPNQSALPADCATLEGLFDHLRMLDADGYPRAFVRHGDVRLELSHARLEDDRVVATVTIAEDQR
ncbi:MAG TPA: hypothetical protein VD926_02695, partial [Acidimicrobiales bacterium]|nr:hypothetical protein [Acidimicrobiales bacterium]